MSEVEQFWVAIAAKFGDKRQWSQLQPQEQHQIVMGVNMILGILK